MLERIQATRASTDGKLLPSDTFARSSYVRWATNQYEQCCLISSTRAYHLIPSSGIGAEGTNYNTTSFGYDQMLRRDQTTSPGGTINITIYDDRSLVSAVYVGTDATGAIETDPTGGGANGNNHSFRPDRAHFLALDGGALGSARQVPHRMAGL